MNQATIALGTALLLVLASVGVADAPPDLVPIETPSYTERHIAIYDMSADGQLAVGSKPFGSRRPYLWTDGKISTLAFDPFPTQWGVASGITADGHTIVGFTTSEFAAYALAWRGGQIEYLPRLEFEPLNRYTYPGASAAGVSSDGRTIIGSVKQLGDDRRTRSVAALWRDGVLETLPDPPDATASWGGLISADGATAVGSAIVGVFKTAILWRDGVAEVLPRLPGGSYFRPEALSPDGRVIVGYANDDEAEVAVRYEDGRLEPLAKLDPGFPKGRATLLAQNGELVFGWNAVGPPADCIPSYACSTVGEGVVWSAEHGVRPIEEWLRYGCGYDYMVNWHGGLMSVTDDGRRGALSVVTNHSVLGQYFWIDLDACHFDYEVPEWTTTIGDYYFADYGESAIWRLNRVTGDVERITSFGGIFRPVDIELDAQRNIVVLSSSWDRIVRHEPETGATHVVATAGLIDLPLDLEIGHDGALYTTQRGWWPYANQIIRTDPLSGEQAVLSEGGWLQARGLTKNAQGNLLVPSNSEGDWWVIEIDVETGEQRQLVRIDMPRETLVRSMTYDRASDTVRIIPGGSERVLVVDLQTGAVHELGSPPPAGIVGSDLPTVTGRELVRIEAQTGEWRTLQAAGHLEYPNSLREIRPLCSDGLDNDGDGRVDEADPACVSLAYDSESVRSDVAIEFTPNGAGDRIIAGSSRTLQVVLRGSPSLDVADVDRDSLAFGPAGAAPRANGPEERDVDGDGYVDLLLHVRLSETGLAAGDTSACLTGAILGDTFEACAAVAVEEPGRRG